MFWIIQSFSIYLTLQHIVRLLGSNQSIYSTQFNEQIWVILYLFSAFQLFAHNLMYIIEDKLIILGGYDLDKKGTNFGSVIQIK